MKKWKTAVLASAVTGIVLLCCFVAALKIVPAATGVPDDPAVPDRTVSPDNTETEETVPAVTDSEETSGEVEWFIPPYTAPSLEELYQMEPYDILLPKKLLPSLLFSSSYIPGEIDEKYLGLGTRSSEPQSYLSVQFREKGLSANPACGFEIQVNNFKKDSRLADPNDPSTYELQPYYDAVNGGTLPKDLPDVSGLFYAEDITKEIVSAKICTISGGLRKAEIGIICGEYVVSYGYVGPDIPADDFYDMITSSVYYEEMLSR